MAPRLRSSPALLRRLPAPATRHATAHGTTCHLPCTACLHRVTPLVRTAPPADAGGVPAGDQHHEAPAPPTHRAVCEAPRGRAACRAHACWRPAAGGSLPCLRPPPHHGRRASLACAPWPTLCCARLPACPPARSWAPSPSRRTCASSPSLCRAARCSSCCTAPRRSTPTSGGACRWLWTLLAAWWVSG